MGPYGSLNLSYTVGDDEWRVDENMRRAAEPFGAHPEDLFTAYQEHGTQATVVDARTPRRPRSDILMSTAPGQVLLLRFADCTPILLADKVTGAVAAVHAGWRGTAARVVTAALKSMRSAFGTRACDVLAGVGPAIGPCCYVVGQDVIEAFADRSSLVHYQSGGAAVLDLWHANRLELLEAGVPADAIEVARICTSCARDDFFSHRANNGRPAGRFGALIGLA